MSSTESNNLYKFLTALLLIIGMPGQVHARPEQGPMVIYNGATIRTDQLAVLADNLHTSMPLKNLEQARNVEYLTKGELNYPLIVLMSGRLPTRPSHMLSYLEAGGSLLWAIDESLDDNGKLLLKHFGLRSVGSVKDLMHRLDEGLQVSKNFAKDHFLSSAVDPKTHVEYGDFGFEIVPNGDKLLFNDLIRPFLFAEESARSEVGKFGDQIVLGATLDGRNGGRILIISSTAPFTRDNRKLSSTLLSWAQKKSGVIRLDSFDHVQGKMENSDAYIVRTDFDVTACFSRLEKNGSLVPFTPNDVQVELILQQPRERITLSPDAEGRCLQGRMIVPDVYGRYTLNLDYTRPGLPIIQAKRMISARPPWLDQVPRFVFAAIPYYFGWQSQLLVTCLILLPLLLSHVQSRK